MRRKAGEPVRLDEETAYQLRARWERVTPGEPSHELASALFAASVPLDHELGQLAARAGFAAELGAPEELDRCMRRLLGGASS